MPLDTVGLILAAGGLACGLLLIILGLCASAARADRAMERDYLNVTSGAGLSATVPEQGEVARGAAPALDAAPTSKGAHAAG